nr:MAG TPA: Baseplate structural protein [Caudoviricetes sp.]
METHGTINWNSKRTGNGTKIYGNLSLMNPYVAVCYWRRVA